jgi:hypothetical protein
MKYAAAAPCCSSKSPCSQSMINENPEKIVDQADFGTLSDTDDLIDMKVSAQ